jgi:hypothetical protein
MSVVVTSLLLGRVDKINGQVAVVEVTSGPLESILSGFKK